MFYIKRGRQITIFAAAIVVLMAFGISDSRAAEGPACDAASIGEAVVGQKNITPLAEATMSAYKAELVKTESCLQKLGADAYIIIDCMEGYYQRLRGGKINENSSNQFGQDCVNRPGFDPEKTAAAWALGTSYLTDRMRSLDFSKFDFKKLHSDSSEASQLIDKIFGNGTAEAVRETYFATPESVTQNGRPTTIILGNTAIVPRIKKAPTLSIESEIIPLEQLMAETKTTIDNLMQEVKAHLRTSAEINSYTHATKKSIRSVWNNKFTRSTLLGPVFLSGLSLPDVNPETSAEQKLFKIQDKITRHIEHLKYGLGFSGAKLADISTQLAAVYKQSSKDLEGAISKVNDIFYADLGLAGASFIIAGAPLLGFAASGVLTFAGGGLALTTGIAGGLALSQAISRNTHGGGGFFCNLGEQMIKAQTGNLTFAPVTAALSVVFGPLAADIPAVKVLAFVAGFYSLDRQIEGDGGSIDQFNASDRLNKKAKEARVYNHEEAAQALEREAAAMQAGAIYHPATTGVTLAAALWNEFRPATSIGSPSLSRASAPIDPDLPLGGKWVDLNGDGIFHSVIKLSNGSYSVGGVKGITTGVAASELNYSASEMANFRGFTQSVAAELDALIAASSGSRAAAGSSSIIRRFMMEEAGAMQLKTMPAPLSVTTKHQSAHVKTQPGVRVVEPAIPAVVAYAATQVPGTTAFTQIASLQHILDRSSGRVNLYRQAVQRAFSLEALAELRYGDVFGATSLKRLLSLGKEYGELIADPGIVLRLDEFIAFAKPRLAMKPSAWTLRQDFSAHLGTRTVYRGMLLTKEQVDQIAKSGIDARYLRISEGGFIKYDQVDPYSHNIFSMMKERIFAPTAEIENAPSLPMIDGLLSVTDDPQIAIEVGSYGLEDPIQDQKLFIYKLNIPQLDLLTYPGGDPRQESFILFKIQPEEILSVEQYLPAFSAETKAVFDHLNQPITPARKAALNKSWKKLDKKRKRLDLFGSWRENRKKIVKLLAMRTSSSQTLNGIAVNREQALEANKNFKLANEFLLKQLLAGHDVTEKLIGQLNSIHLHGKLRDSQTSSYRQDERVLGNDLFKLITPKDIHGGMQELIAWYNSEKDQMHPIELASRFYQKLISIHPFIDANGRTSRDVMDFILMKNGYPPAIFDGSSISRSAVIYSLFNPPAGWPGTQPNPTEITVSVTKAVENTFNTVLNQDD